MSCFDDDDDDAFTLTNISEVPVTEISVFSDRSVFWAAEHHVWQISIDTQELPGNHLGSVLPVIAGSVLFPPPKVIWPKCTAVPLTNELLYRVAFTELCRLYSSTTGNELHEESLLHTQHGKVTVQFKFLWKVTSTLWGIDYFFYPL